MAHYKRKRPRTAARTTFMATPTLLKRLGVPLSPHGGLGAAETRRRFLIGGWPDWVRGPMGNHPRWWDLVFHTRPHRARTKAIARRIMRGEIDPDDTAWPLPDKPTKYFW